jgi:hypothetical protein
MDNELLPDDAADVRIHLASCADCSAFCEQIAAIIEFCKEDAPVADEMPDRDLMWLKINNIIENDAKPVVPEPKRRFWQVSFAQAIAAVVCIAIFSSVVTVAVIRNSSMTPAAELLSRSSQQTTFEKVLSKVGLVESPHEARERLIRERQTVVDYWNARVQTRRLQWDSTTREAFDRNLRVIDESVSEYTYILQQDPEDELSGEMLDSVLNDKVNLLRDFAEL